MKCDKNLPGGRFLGRPKPVPLPVPGKLHWRIVGNLLASKSFHTFPPQHEGSQNPLLSHSCFTTMIQVPISRKDCDDSETPDLISPVAEALGICHLAGRVLYHPTLQLTRFDTHNNTLR